MYLFVFMKVLQVSVFLRVSFLSVQATLARQMVLLLLISAIFLKRHGPSTVKPCDLACLFVLILVMTLRSEIVERLASAQQKSSLQCPLVASPKHCKHVIVRFTSCLSISSAETMLHQIRIPRSCMRTQSGQGGLGGPCSLTQCVENARHPLPGQMSVVAHDMSEHLCARRRARARASCVKWPSHISTNGGKNLYGFQMNLTASHLQAAQGTMDWLAQDGGSVYAD
jgi:hypothetical protein